MSITIAREMILGSGLDKSIQVDLMQIYNEDEEEYSDSTALYKLKTAIRDLKEEQKEGKIE